jgi:muramoyltetrapeptide carboxypeptidase
MSAPSTLRDKASKPAVLPEALRAGDAVRLISPASWFDPNKVQAGMDSLQALGLQPQLGVNALARYGQYSAGTAEQRLEDLYAAFSDPSVKAIICNRGGYGSAEMLSGLDLDVIRCNPKIFVACSDITSLETYIHDQTGLVMFHGPMAAGEFARPNGVDPVSWQAALSQDCSWQLRTEAGLRTLKAGSAQGKLSGHAVRNPNKKHDPVPGGYRRQAVSNRPHAAAVTSRRETRPGTWHRFRPYAGLRATGKCE